MDNKIIFVFVFVISISISISISGGIGMWFYTNKKQKMQQEEQQMQQEQRQIQQRPMTQKKQQVKQVKECVLECEDVRDIVKDYYDNDGEWKNVFTMNPLKTNKVSDNQCDVYYDYIPVDGGGRNDTGQDKRRFTLESDGNCSWGVTLMGKYQSGITL